MKEGDFFETPFGNKRKIVAPRTTDEEELFLAQQYHNHWQLLEAKLAYGVEDGRNRRLILLEQIAEDLSRTFGVASRDRRFVEQKIRDMKKNGRRCLLARRKQLEGFRKEPNKAIKLIVEALENKDLLKATVEIGKNIGTTSFGQTDGMLRCAGEEGLSDEMEFLEEDTNLGMNNNNNILLTNTTDSDLPLFVKTGLGVVGSNNNLNSSFTMDNSFNYSLMNNNLFGAINSAPVANVSFAFTNNCLSINQPLLYESIADFLQRQSNGFKLETPLSLLSENIQPLLDHHVFNKDLLPENKGLSKSGKSKKERKVRGSNQVWKCVTKFETSDQYEAWLNTEIGRWYRNKRIQLTSGYQHLFYCRYSQKAGYQQCRSQMRANYSNETGHISIELNDKEHHHEHISEHGDKRMNSRQHRLPLLTSFSIESNSSLDPSKVVTTQQPNNAGLLTINSTNFADSAHANIDTSTNTNSTVSNESNFTIDSARSPTTSISSNEHHSSDGSRTNPSPALSHKANQKKSNSYLRNMTMQRMVLREELDKNREIKKFYQLLNQRLETVSDGLIKFLELGSTYFSENLNKSDFVNMK
uniref:Uncharacterized protein n=1 Tax=Rhabditophanes sp. KR3021 TaxID=114890 RepID=A0AC35TV42_9BILA